MSILSHFPISSRELNEILYDYLDPDIKPTFSIGFYNETVDEVKYELIRITCLKCCGIVRNPEFTESGTQRPWFKKMNTIRLFSNQRIKDEVKKATYFEWKDHKNKLTKGHYEFTQLTAREQYAVANIIFDENHKDIPESFLHCTNGECKKP